MYHSFFYWYQYLHLFVIKKINKWFKNQHLTRTIFFYGIIVSSIIILIKPAGPQILKYPHDYLHNDIFWLGKWWWNERAEKEGGNETILAHKYWNTHMINCIMISFWLGKWHWKEGQKGKMTKKLYKFWHPFPN